MAALHRLLRSAGSRPHPATRFSSLPSSSSTQDPRLPATMVHKAAAPSARRGAAERNVQWVFLGCPGVGKGTYASKLSNLLGVPHIATGDLVRDELNSSGPLSKQEAQLYAEDNDLFFVETSAKTAMNVNDMFYEIARRLPRARLASHQGMILDNRPAQQPQASSCCS